MFDDGDEVVLETEDGLARRDRAGRPNGHLQQCTRQNWWTLPRTMREPVNRRIDFVPQPAEFAAAYLDGFSGTFPADSGAVPQGAECALTPCSAAAAVSPRGEHRPALGGSPAAFGQDQTAAGDRSDPGPSGRCVQKVTSTPLAAERGTGLLSSRKPESPANRGMAALAHGEQRQQLVSEPRSGCTRPGPGRSRGPCRRRPAT